MKARSLICLTLAVAGFVLINGCSRPDKKIIPPEDVWAYIEKEAPRYHLDPGFVYSLAFAESSFNAYAETSVARGITHISEGAWETVTDISYDRAWNWRTNLSMAMAYLAHCRAQLVEVKHFNYPLLAASYRYGPGAVKRAGYSLAGLPKPTNKIYQQFFAGHIHPHPPPMEEDG